MGRSHLTFFFWKRTRISHLVVTDFRFLTGKVFIIQLSNKKYIAQHIIIHNRLIIVTQSVYNAFSMVGNIFTILLVHRLGKRCLVLLTITVCSLCYLSIGFIEFFFTNSKFTSCTVLALFFLSAFSSSLGIMPIGWVLMSEVFPMKYVVHHIIMSNRL